MSREEMERLVHSVVRRLRTEYGGTEYDDLVGQSWLIIAESIDKYDKERGASLSTYLYIQVEGHLRNYIERVILRGLHLQGHRAHVSTVPDVPIDNEMDTKIQLEQMVSLETGIYRDVLLCMIGGLSQSEAAKELNISRQRVSQVLEGIRRKYNE